MNQARARLATLFLGTGTPVLLALGACGGGSDGGKAAPPATLALTGTLHPAPGLAAGDFEVWGPSGQAGTSPGVDGAAGADGSTSAGLDGSASPGVDGSVAAGAGSVGADGTFVVTASGRMGGFLFAGPRAGTVSASKTGAASGLYMTPTLGEARLVGPPYKVASDGPAALDASTTVLSFILMHPMFAHPSASVMRQQAAWLADRLAAGWTELSAAAARLDADYAAGIDYSTDPAFTTPFQQALTAAQDAMPAFAPDEPWAAHIYAGSQYDNMVHLAKAGNVVSTLAVKTASASGATLKPGTVTGTGLDYYFEVRTLSNTEFPGWINDTAFTSPVVLVERNGTVLASGFVASSSYFSYLDVVGNTLRKITSFIATPIKPTDTFDVPVAKQMYEVRFFSGGVGAGAGTAEGRFAQDHYGNPQNFAFVHNVTGGAIEGLMLIPGAEAVLGDDVGSQVMQEALKKLITEMETMISSKGAQAITANDIYTLTFNTMKAAVDKFIAKLSENTQKAAWERLIRWVGWGGEKAVKTIMSLPGKVAKGGALANRAARLVSPESMMEVWLVAVDAAEGQSVKGSYFWTYDMSTSDMPVVSVKASWDVACAGVTDEISLTNKQDFVASISCASGKPASLSLEQNGVFMASSWTRSLGNGQSRVVTPTNITTIVPVLNQSYGSYQLLTQTGTFPLTVTGTDQGLAATWTFSGANQSIFLGPALQVTYDVTTVNADKSLAGTESKQWTLQFGALNLTSK